MAFEFNNPILYFLRAGNSEDPYISKSDSRLIVNNTITLSEIPNEFSGTTILNYFETRSNTAIESNQFFVNYLNGAISFNPSENGKTVVANYLGRGIIQIPAERIYSTDGNDVTQTLQNMINNGSVAIETLGGLTAAISTAQSLENELDSDIATGNILKSDLDSRFNTADTKKIALDLSISNSNTSKTNLDASISTSGASKTALDLSNTNANITKSNLDSSNTTALATKVLLDGSNTTALETKIALDLSDTTANITKNNLDDSIDSAAIINGTLDGTIVTANFSIGELNETNATAQANEDTRISQENTRQSQEDNRQNTYSSGHINFKGIVTGIASLPASDNILGDTYQVIDDAITANNAMWRYNGTIFEKSYVLDLTFAGGYGANNSQVFTATANQTVFTLTEFPYLIGVNQLMVYVTGIKQIIGDNYTETSTNSFTLTSGVVAGTKVEAFRSVPGGAGSLTTQEVENARVSSLGVGYANLKARIDAHDFEKVGVLSGLPTVAKTDIVSSINEFYDDVEEYKAENAHVSLSSFPIIVPEIDDSARFKRAIDQALVDKRGLMIPYSYLEISQGDIALNYPIEILGLGSNSTPIADSKYQTVIRYSGIAPLFTIDVPNFTHWSGFSFRKFRFISETGAGGFITINKDKIMLTPPNVQPCGPFNRGLFEDVQFEKVYIDTTPATLDGAVCIDGVALFNNVFNRCEFVGWDLVVNTPQSDINLFKKCLFTRNVQIAKFKNLNTYGSQNRFHHCDFEIRRLGVEAFYQFEDYAKYTSWNDCYFEVGGTPSGVKPKGWFDFNGGAWHKVIEGRFDIIPSRIETEFCCITSASFGVTFEHCTASDFNTDVSKNAYIEPRFKTNGYSTQSHRGVQFIGCSPQFLSYFDLKNSSATHYSSKWGTIHKTKDDARPKRIIYNVHNFDETSETMYTTEKDDLSLTGYVFKLKKTTSVGMGAVVDGLYFDFLVNNSIVKTGGMYKVKIRAKNTTAGQAAKLRAKIVRLSSAKAFVSSIGVHYEQAGTAEGYYETTLNIKQTGVDAGSGQSTVWNTGEYVRVYIHAHDGVGTDAVDTGILIDSVEIEEVQPYIYLAGSDGNMYIVDINTTDSTLRVVKKATAEEVYPSSTY